MKLLLENWRQHLNETSDSTRVFRTDGGKIEVMENSKWAGGAHSILSFFVDEDKRGRGKGQELIQMVINAYPGQEISAQVSSPASLKAFMKKGFVPPEEPDADYDRALKLFNDNRYSLNVRINLGRNK